jgi:hypothetical protein
MNEATTAQRLILCGGLQSGGTTLVAWCFLQRSDTNGVLDAGNKRIQTDFDRVVEPVVWLKTTIGALRWLDLSHVYRDLGWHPEPLLVVRDVRAVLASLLTKDYGINGVTLDEPPLRLRFRRFLADWELFREQGWPILVFEDFLREPRRVLRETCDALGLPYEEEMLAWPKTLADIAYVHSQPNSTFASTLERGSGVAVILRDKIEPDLSNVPAAELDWLEDTFADYNTAHGYPAVVSRGSGQPRALSRPRFAGTQWQRTLAKLDGLAVECEALRTDVLQLEIERVIPPGERIALVDKGKPLELAGDREPLPFPLVDGDWGGYPADDDEAIAALERMRAEGIGFIVIPATMRYWLDIYPRWASHLTQSATVRGDTHRVLILQLRPDHPQPDDPAQRLARKAEERNIAEHVSPAADDS